MVISWITHVVNEQITLFLDKAFKIKYLKKLKYFLNLEVAQSSTGIHISQ